jgi:hypothetical protein
MPIQPNPDTLVMWPHQANISAPGLSISVQLQPDGSGTEVDLDAVLQDMIDYLQAWPGKLAGSNATGQVYDVKLYAVTPTNPEDPPPPPVEEPEGNEAQPEPAPEG